MLMSELEQIVTMIRDWFCLRKKVQYSIWLGNVKVRVLELNDERSLQYGWILDVPITIRIISSWAELGIKSNQSRYPKGEPKNSWMKPLNLNSNSDDGTAPVVMPWWGERQTRVLDFATTNLLQNPSIQTYNTQPTLHPNHPTPHTQTPLPHHWVNALIVFKLITAIQKSFHTPASLTFEPNHRT